MGQPRSNLRFGVPLASTDGRYYTRWPRGDRPIPVGAGVTAAVSAALAFASAIGESGFYYVDPERGSVVPDIYIDLTAHGNGSGSSEANAAVAATVLARTDIAPGTVIGALPGVWSKASGGERYAPAWRCASSGTADDPIVIVTKYSGIDLSGRTSGKWTADDYAAVLAHPNRTELRHTGVSTDGAGNGGPVLGIVDTDHVWWVGFCADEAHAQPHRDTGLSILWSTTGSRVMRCVLYARDPGYVTFDYDNHPNVRLENAIDCVVSDNALDGDFEGPTHNHCCIQRYESTGTRIEHNMTGGLFSGIYLKDQDNARDEIVRFNLTSNPRIGIEILNTNIGVGDTDEVYQNLILDSVEGLIYQSQGFNIQAHHNTIVIPATSPGTGSCWVAHHNGSGSYLRESILVGTVGSAFVDQSFRTAAVNGSNYNRYFRSGTAFTARYNGSTHSSIEAWRSATGQDANSSVGTPSFVDQAGGNFRLAGGSACLTMSNTGGPIGCYITGAETIGPRYLQ